MAPIDYNAFWISFTPKNRHVGDVSRTGGGTVYFKKNYSFAHLALALKGKHLVHFFVLVYIFMYTFQRV